MDSLLYPQGTTPHYTKYVNGVLKFFKRSDRTEFFAIDGSNGLVYEPGAAYTTRVRATAAEVNAGKVVVAGIPGYKIRVVDSTMIAVGGAAGTAASVDLVATQAASSVRLVVNDAASLTQSARVSMGEAPAAGTSVILADGASFVVNDANTGIYVAKQAAPGDLDTATHIDVVVTYELVRA